jgi:hypothetical protein
MAKIPERKNEKKKPSGDGNPQEAENFNFEDIFSTKRPRRPDLIDPEPENEMHAHMKNHDKTEEEKIAERSKYEIDPYLDHLYNTTVRCPYCRLKILKYTTTCIRCGVSKIQLYESSNMRARQIKKRKTGERTFMTMRRPFDVDLTKMIFLCIVGFTGAYCFNVGRNIRGWAVMLCLWIGLMGGAVCYFYPPAMAAHEYFRDEMGLMGLPTYFFFIAGIGMWAYDFCGIIFGFFRYPVRLGDNGKK